MDWIAVYAAIVGTLTAGWTTYSIWRDRALVKVDVRFGYVKSSPNGSWMVTSNKFKSSEIDEQTRILIVARHLGRRPFVLSGGGLQFRDGNRSVFSGEGLGKSFPHRLEEGESHSTWAYVVTIRERFSQDKVRPPIWAYWSTETGQVYKSKLRKELIRVLAEA